MCFCQYVLHREAEYPPATVVEQVKDHFTSMKKNAFGKSHRRKTLSGSQYETPLFSKNGVAHFV